VSKSWGSGAHPSVNVTIVINIIVILVKYLFKPTNVTRELFKRK